MLPTLHPSPLTSASPCVSYDREVIQDLLHPNNANLRIREEKNGEVYVQGLSDEYVSSAEDILHLLAVGEKSRTVASTDMNEVSSRSHSVLIIVVNQKLKVQPKSHTLPFLITSPQYPHLTPPPFLPTPYVGW